MRSRRVLQTLGMAAGMFLVIAAAHTADWPARTTTGGALVIGQGNLFSGTTVTQDNVQGGLTNNAGGLAIFIRPGTADAITSVTANGLVVDGYISNISFEGDGTGGSNAFGAFRLMGIDSTPKESITATTFINVDLTNNKLYFLLKGDANSVGSSAYGAGADLRTPGAVTYSGGKITGNALTMTTDAALDNGENNHANGGGLSIVNQTTSTANLSNLKFENNSVTVIDTYDWATSSARGGALFAQNTNDENKNLNYPAPPIQVPADQKGMTLTVTDTTFTNNTVTNNSTDASNTAQGGAYFADIGVRSVFKSTTFTGNQAISTKGAAYGGAVSSDVRNSLSAAGTNSSFEGDLDPIGTVGTTPYWTSFENVEFTNNSAKGATAAGGALYTTHSVLLNGVTFSGNKTIVGTTETANAIHLANPRAAGTGWDRLDGNTTTTAIFADGAGSASYDYDGISSDSTASAILKTGAGDLHLYGNYTGFQGSMTLDAGTTYFRETTDFGTFAGTTALAATATASMGSAKTAVTVNLGVLNQSGTLIAKAIDGGGIANFAVANTSTLSTDATKYKIVGKLTPGVQHTIVTVDSGTVSAAITGALVDSLYGQYHVLGDAGTTVYAELTGAAKELASYGNTFNGINLADYLDRIGSTNSELLEYLENNYDNLGSTQAERDAAVANLLNLATGEAHATASTEIANYSAFAVNNIIGEAHGAWNAWSQLGASTFTTDSAFGSLTELGVAQARVWANLNGYIQNGDGNSRFDSDTNGWGIAIGADRVIGDFLFGAGLRYGNNRTDVDGLGSRTDFDSYTLALYGGYRFGTGTGCFYLDGGLSGTLHDVDATRHDGLGGRYDADYDASALSAFLDAGYSLELTSGLTLQPFANGVWTGTWTDDFTERRTGGIGSALSVSSDDRSNFATTLGGRVFADVGAFVQLDANAGWRHTFGDVDSDFRARFVGSGVAGEYAVRGGSIARNEFVLGAGVTFRPTERLAIRAGYDGAFGDGADTHQGSIRLAISF